MSAVLVFLILLVPLVALDLAALRWGVDSREAPDSAEWERRRNWRGFRRP